jgi:hypothetical protein
MRRILTASLLASLGGCGTGDSVSGSVQGYGLAASDSVFGQSSVTFAGTTLYSTLVTLTDYPNACAVEQAMASQGVVKPNATRLTLLAGAESPIATGTYNVATAAGAPPPAVGAIFDKTGSNCTTVVDGGPLSATGGSVTFTTVSPSRVAGSFTLSFGSDQLTGSFSAAPCGASSGDGGTSLTCG